MVKIGILAMAAAITIVLAGSWLHASANSSKPMARASGDVLPVTLSVRKPLPFKLLDAI
jgi:hypothetical protein